MTSILSLQEINSLNEFTAFIESHLAAGTGGFLYRGCGKSSHKLTPSLFRHPIKTNVAEFFDLEKKLIGRFKQRSIPYQNRELKGEWEYVFFMQHFGVPTRLLDWTENPFLALFFALTSAIQENRKYQDDAALWVLNPSTWNQKVLQHIGFDKDILSVDESVLDPYKPNMDGEPNIALMPSEPVAIYGIHNRPRIIAQRGVFTIFGKNTNPMEDMYINLDFPQGSLTKLILPKDKIESLLSSVISIGITDSVVFPDLEGLAREIKRFFGYRI